MLYTADEMKTSFLDEAMAILEGANYLSEEESRYYPQMVPIRENTRIGRNLIRVEDLIEYSLSNGISDGAYALGQICEAANVDPQTIAFSVDEVSILEDSEMEDTVRQLMAAGAEVYAAPISENDMAYIMAETACDISIMGIEQDEEEYTDTLFEAFLVDDFETFLSENNVVDQIQSKVSYARGKANALYDTKVAPKVSQAKDKGHSIINKIESTMSSAFSKSKEWLAKKISSFRTLLDKFLGKEKATEDKSVKGIIRKIIEKIKQALKYLSQKLSQAADAGVSAAKSVKKGISNKINYAKGYASSI